MKPSDHWKLKLDAHTVFRTRTISGLTALAAASGGRTAVGGGIGAGTSSSRFAGEEIDFVASYSPLKFLTFSGGASVFIPAGFISSNIDNEFPVFGWLQVMGKY